MQFSVYNQQGESVREITFPDSIERLKVNVGLVHQVVIAQGANRRQSNAHTKTRKQVSGGGKKPWKQKGTGRARHGSIRSPIWRGGGTVFGPLSAKNYTQKVNRKMKHRAIAMVLAEKILSHRVVWVEPLAPDVAKTKAAIALLTVWKEKIPNFSQFLIRSHGYSGYVLSAGYQPVGMRAFRNIPGIRFEDARNMNIRDIIAYPYLIIEAVAFPQIVRYFEENQKSKITNVRTALQ